MTFQAAQVRAHTHTHTTSHSLMLIFLKAGKSRTDEGTSKKVPCEAERGEIHRQAKKQSDEKLVVKKKNGLCFF